MTDFDPEDAFEWEEWPDALSVRLWELTDRCREEGLTQKEEGEYRNLSCAWRRYNAGTDHRARAKDDMEFMVQSLDEKLLAIYHRLRGVEPS